jgi:phenylpropionate dioxygenase-like ring-hydroxylating dioxygenase large terminal subunit
MATTSRSETNHLPTLPGRYYHDPAIFALEQERIFATSWMLVGRADRTRVISDALFDPQVMAQPDFDPSDAVEFNDIVSRQDAEVCELSQLGATSRGFRRGGLYGPNELHIRQFDDYVLDMLGHTEG